MGAYTIVYEALCARLLKMERHVTLRVLRYPQAANWFLNTARVAAYLTHPRIPTLREVAGDRGFFFLVRDMIEGDDLQNGIGQRGIWSVSGVVQIVKEVADVLDYAHGNGIVHGYVHPRHILRDHEGRSFLIGFAEVPPPADHVFGNPIHLPPEQFNAPGNAVAASDVFALGETAYWLLSGRHPFSGVRVSGLEAAKNEARFRRIHEVRKDVPPGVDAVLCRSMAPRPEDRFPSAGQFAGALAAAVHDVQPQGKRWWQLWK
jgi:serine/threonine-protein kinase